MSLECCTWWHGRQGGREISCPVGVVCRGVDTSGRIRRLPIGAERVVGRGTDNWNVRIRHDGARSNLFFTRCCATTTVTYHSAPILKPTNALHTFARRAVRAEVTVRAPLTSHVAAPCATRTLRWTSPPNSTQARIVLCACNPDPLWYSRRAGTQRSAKRARYDSENETMDVRKYDCSHTECNVDGNTIVHTALPQMKLSFGEHPLGWYKSRSPFRLRVTVRHRVLCNEILTGMTLSTVRH